MMAHLNGDVLSVPLTAPDGASAALTDLVGEGKLVEGDLRVHGDLVAQHHVENERQAALLHG